MRTNGFRTGLRALAAVLALGALGACGDFLAVENPGAIEEPSLNDPTYIPLMVNGVVGEFQPMLPVMNYYSSVFTDELRNHHVFFEERLIDQRRVGPENATYVAFHYNLLHRSRFLADSVAGRLKVLLADSAMSDNRLARVQAYAGYTYVLLAEQLCESPVNLSRPYTSAELLTQFALPRFDEAIAVATAAKGRAGATAAQIAAADSVLNFARVGAARASLWLNDKPKAIAYATPVPTAFEFRAYFSENSTRENNPIWGRMSSGSSGSNSGSLTNTPFEALAGDPRVPRPVATERVMDATNAFIPNSPSAYSTYTGTAVGGDFSRAGWMRIASGLEARYIEAEARGPTAESIAFIESRRAVYPTGTTATDAANFYANVRDQRRRDFYFDGHRLGDLRRYIAQYGVNEFPTGGYPGSSTGETYGDQICLPLSLAEINGNPNVPH
jgi:hypothetical protein